MKKIIILTVITILVSLTGRAQEKFIADKENSILQWTGEGVTRIHTGNIKLQDGWLIWHDNRIVSGEFIIDMASITESKGTEKLVGHLKSADFFEVGKFPVSRLVITGSTSFEKGSATVTGNLTIKGMTNPVEFRAVRQVKEDGVWYYSNITVDRTKFNVRYGSGSFFDNLGDKAIFDEFKLKVNLLVKN